MLEDVILEIAQMVAPVLMGSFIQSVVSLALVLQRYVSYPQKNLIIISNDQFSFLQGTQLQYHAFNISDKIGNNPDVPSPRLQTRYCREIKILSMILTRARTWCSRAYRNRWQSNTEIRVPYYLISGKLTYCSLSFPAIVSNTSLLRALKYTFPEGDGTCWYRQISNECTLSIEK